MNEIKYINMTLQCIQMGTEIGSDSGQKPSEIVRLGQILIPNNKLFIKQTNKQTYSGENK